MKHLIIVAVVTATVSTTDSFQLRYAEGGAARDQSRSRHVALSRGTPIPAVIVPNDDFVIVERDQTGTTVTLAPVINDRDEDLGQRAAGADVIAVVEVSNIEGKLVDDDTWVETNVTVGARQVIRDTVPSALRPDMSITFNHSGGKIHIGRVRVRADHHYLFERGERYLVFLRRISREGMVSVGLVKFPFRITDDQRLAPMTMSTGTPMTVPSPLYGLDLKTVIAELKARIRPQ